ncbi:hypothetical protein [Rhizobium sp. ICMP 5592]|uniref:hypothetical protein n=1 Tax=Rhizobium sp. ICMP 5592 TaxID=2292445 RepID=UPI0012974618|nr:hypothetical protein [Rhizobium sp. ICMP 5592]MQB44271.1 hypothetical protein [Rhizobium sp. ICMP 5592]
MPVVIHRPVVMPALPMMMTMVHLRCMMPMVMVIISGFGVGCGQSENAQRDESCCQDFHFPSPWVPEQTSGWGEVMHAYVVTNAASDNAIASCWFQVAFK